MVKRLQSSSTIPPKLETQQSYFYSAAKRQEEILFQLRSGNRLTQVPLMRSLIWDWVFLLVAKEVPKRALSLSTVDVLRRLPAVKTTREFVTTVNLLRSGDWMIPIRIPIPMRYRQRLLQMMNCIRLYKAIRRT